MLRLLSDSQYHIDEHLGSGAAKKKQKTKKYDLKFKLSVVKYAEEYLGEAAARRFSVEPKRVREKVPGCLVEGGRRLVRSLRYTCGNELSANEHTMKDRPTTTSLAEDVQILN